MRIGVIGAGGRGRLVDLAHRPDDGFSVVAGADLDPAVLADFRSRYGDGAFTTTDYRELLARADVDAVFVTAPDFLHEPIALDAIKAGKTLFLEKPMAITIAGCDHILRAAMERRVRLYIGHNMRHFGVVRKMKEWIDAGRIGQVKAVWCRHFVAYGGEAYFRDWHADRTKTTGLLLQKGAHDMDVMHWLCGGYAKVVSAMGGLTVYGDIPDKHGDDERGDATFGDTWPPTALTGLNPVVDVEDQSMVLMRLDNGVYGSYQQCHFSPDAWRNYTVIGTEGRIENFGDSPGNCTIKLWNRRVGYRAEADDSFELPPDEGSHGGSDERMVSEFLRFARDGGKTDTSPVAARMSVAAGCVATDSLRSGGGAIPIPELDPTLQAYFDAGQI